MFERRFARTFYGLLCLVALAPTATADEGTSPTIPALFDAVRHVSITTTSTPGGYSVTLLTDADFEEFQQKVKLARETLEKLDVKLQKLNESLEKLERDNQEGRLAVRQEMVATRSQQNTCRTTISSLRRTAEVVAVSNQLLIVKWASGQKAAIPTHFITNIIIESEPEADQPVPEAKANELP